ncbi:phosphotransferase family protein [Actinoplanes sp. NPDC051494]|uniref:phosphotransferase family protein n=1 Tax=Actinoplanes sp. NPDC051494 TaxID=3363907 RepID=UPI00378EF496
MTSDQHRGRRRWSDLPPPVRAHAETRLHARVVGADSQPGGFTDGVAARLRLSTGARAFLKAIPAGHELAGDYRMEATISAALPTGTPAPRLRFAEDTGDWILLCYDDVEGHTPDLADPGDLRAVLDALHRMGEVLSPNPVPGVRGIGEPLGPLFHGWRNLAAADALSPWQRRHADTLLDMEHRWIEASSGTTLLHADLRQDNLIRTTAGDVVAVDWAWACVGADWVDLVYLLPAVAAAGGDPEPLLGELPATRDADPDAITVFLATMTGFYLHSGGTPDPQWSPHLRAHEARFGRLCEQWLRRRTGWA